MLPNFGQFLAEASTGRHLRLLIGLHPLLVPSKFPFLCFDSNGYMAEIEDIRSGPAVGLNGKCKKHLLGK